MHRITVVRLIAACAVVVLAASAPGVTSAAPVDAPRRCEAAKNRAAGKYAFCRQKAAAKLATTGDGPQYTDAISKCELKFSGAWQKATARAVASGTICSDDRDLKQGVFDDSITSHADNIKHALAGAGFVQDCQNDLATCQGNLGTCEAAQQGKLLKTGQTLCYDSSGSAIDCAGTGHDGELQLGLAPSYTDNGDGTITDHRTGLMWEKLADDGSIHDWDDVYNRRGAFDKVAALNSASFAGHADWRVPNVNELQSLVNYGALDPAVDAIFNTACAPGCSITTCSCTHSEEYFSSTADGWVVYFTPDDGWIVNFLAGGVTPGGSGGVRAVRSGS